jgi:hypothetical protein
MRASPMPAPISEVDSNGFTLVEEDDVAFTLVLCREVNRIYGNYQDGELVPSENVWAGLSLTLKMLTSLQGAVVDGMPSMRLQVASAQAREMHAVLFGELPSSRGQGRLAGIGAPKETGDGRLALHQVPAQKQLTSPESAIGTRDQSDDGPRPLDQRIPVGAFQRWRQRWAAWLASRSSPVRMLIGLAICCVIATLIDVPFAVVALFPSLFIPVAVSSVSAPILIRVLYRGWSMRSQRRVVGLAA